MAQAKVKAYAQFMDQEEIGFNVPETTTSVPLNEHNRDLATEIANLTREFSDSIGLSRIPIPEPSIFYGDPLKYLEWKTAFEILIERKNIPSNERVFYLKRYLGHPASKVLEGMFMNMSNSSYGKAKQILDDRYGHPFVLQKAFRDKLDKWPKIGKDPVALLEFSDFLKCCLDAIPHVPSLSILNDCVENQKLIAKLPDWVASRWNRIATESLDVHKTFPTFEEFVMFLDKEARIATNPISSPFSLQTSLRRNQEQTLKAKVLATTGHKKEISSYVCEFCEDQEHGIHKCDKFRLLENESKQALIKRKNLCFGCLRKGHQKKNCRRRHTCDICKLRHPTCLHTERLPAERENRPELTSVSSFSVNKGSFQSTSMIVPVWVSNPSTGHEIMTYALLDTQSDTTFILEELVEKLQFDNRQTQKTRLSLSTMTSQNTVIESTKVYGLNVRALNSTESVSVNHAYSRSFIPAERSHIPTKEVTLNWPHLRHLYSCIPSIQACEVGLLIGYNCPQALAPKETVTGKANEPYAIRTILGWSVVGYFEATCPPDKTTTHRIFVKEKPVCTPRDAIRILESDFQHDEESYTKLSHEDMEFIRKLNSGIRQREDQHLEMPLPFMKESPCLPNNRSSASYRLESLKRKFAKDEKYYEDYKRSMEEMLRRGDAELVTTQPTVGREWYIPHHGVYHPKKPDKLRVVFDCSAMHRNASLNQHLLMGPDQLNCLLGVLLRFRRYGVAVMCDIERMFHQFFVPEEDRDYLRFLWWENGMIDSKPLVYRMKVHLFGAASSPGCANFGLKYLALAQKASHPEASAFVYNDFYVDDGLASLTTESDAIKLMQDAKTLCASGGLRLHKFVSNSRDALLSIPESERAAEFKTLDLLKDPLPTVHALGLNWCIQDDKFVFESMKPEGTPTRRSILSTVSSIYDPMGFLAPLTFTGKRILQETCREGVSWDEPLIEESVQEWEKWIQDLQDLNEFSIDRCIIPAPVHQASAIELHHFSDASSRGYGQCSYIRIVHQDGVHCAFILGKSRVAPLRPITIPRLELNAAVLSVKMSLFLRKELGIPIQKEYFWTDSQVVLGYIRNESRRFHVFVANRTKLIRDITEPEQWHYIESQSNPADHASRGLRLSEIANSSWLHGPEFLRSPELHLTSITTDLQPGDPEVRAHTLRAETSTSFELDLSRFSRWTKAVSVVARIQRMANGETGTHTPSAEERIKAERSIIRFMQSNAFPEAFYALRNSSQLPKTNQLYSLDPEIRNGLLCVGGRLGNLQCDVSAELAHPIILPKNNHITDLILSHVHEEVHHQGRGITLMKLRLCGYWIIGAGRKVNQAIRQCVTCRKLRRPTECQKMADLPNDRVEASPPFLYCGMDCFGPFFAKRGRSEVKRYGLIITCMCSRAIHIEMLDDMTSDCLINALRCFIAIRGTVRQLRWDNGSNFIGAKNELQPQFVEDTTKQLAERQCEFVFNAPDASHSGGVWERQIRTVRSILSHIFSACPKPLDDSGLRTVLYEVMAIVNSRPLTVSDLEDPGSIEPLTPNHILTAKSSVPYPPPGEFERADLFLRKRWRKVQFLLEQFWSRWRREYLAQIALRTKWHEPRRNVCVGDVVLVKDATLPRMQWPLARVMEAKPDGDGLVRRVKIKTRTSDALERSVHKLVLLLSC